MAEAAQQIPGNPNPAPAFLVIHPIPINNVRPLNWRNRPRRRMGYSQDQRQRAILLRQRGYSFRQIARRMGPFCSVGTVYQWVRQARNQGPH